MEKVVVLTLDYVVENGYDLDLMLEIAEDPDQGFLCNLFHCEKVIVSFTPDEIREAKKMLFESAFEDVDFEEMMQDSGLNSGCFVRSTENGQRNGGTRAENTKFLDAVTQGLLHPDHVGKEDETA